MTSASDGAQNLSKRARAGLENANWPAYLEEHFARLGNDEYVPMCIAENKLMWDLLSQKVQAPRDVPEDRLGYDDMIGSLDFREQLASFFREHVLHRSFKPEEIAVLAGGGSVLEILFWCLADPGDAVLVPTPSYAGFWLDLEGRDELHIVPVHTRASDEFRLTVELLDQALESSSRPIRALLFTSPNNPTGAVYSRKEIEEIVAWAREHEIHLVFDEVYALSIHGERDFVSVAEVAPLADDIHIVWAFSKDFAASGLRCGALVSQNAALMQSVAALAYWACCSGDSQHLCGQMLSDERWLDEYVRELRKRLRASYEAVTRELSVQALPFRSADAGFFFLLDLRSHLREVSFEAETELWRDILEKTHINLTPGHSLRSKDPGWFRLCFASVSPLRARQAVAELGRYLSSRT